MRISWRAAVLMCGAMLVPGVRANAARPPDRIIDPGLHRQWLIERDRVHPERPARLVEAPWREVLGLPGGRAQDPARPAVGIGTKVMLCFRDEDTKLRLTGWALEPGRPGDVIRVRAGLHGAILRGVVLGPGVVELERGRR
jgi:hypothetical protein